MRLIFLFAVCCGMWLPSVSGFAQSNPTDSEPAHTVPDLPHLRRAIAALPDSGQIDQLREYCGVLAETGRFEEAQATMQLADSIAEQSGSLKLRAGVAYSNGYLATMQEAFPQALTHYQRSLDLYRRAGDYSRQVTALLRLGNTSAEAGNLAAAESYTQQALALAQRQKLRTRQADIYGELANLADRRKQPKVAVAFTDKALAIYRSEANWPSYYIGLLNQGIHYKNLGHFAEAAQAYEDVLAFTERENDDYLRGYTYLNLPFALLPLGRVAEAEQYARLGLAWLQKVPQAHGFHDVYDALARIKEQQGDFRQALAYHRLATAYNDSLRNDEQHRELLQVEARYQTREKQAQITQLNRDNAQQNRQLWLLGAGLALLTALLIGNLVQFRALRRTNGQLQASNAQVNEQAHRLRVLLRELNHRVKNNLAMVSSLLQMQARRLTDDRAARAVREGQQRVDALSLIHQRLYHNDLVTSIDLPRYVAELTQNLLTAYGFDPNRFTLRLAVTQPTLDVEVAIPLGLILNEILTNAFKHAYRGVAHPALDVQLGPDEAGYLVLNVRDNGQGFEPNARPTNSFGQRLIKALSEQLGAELKVTSEHGTHYCLRIAPDRFAASDVLHSPASYAAEPV